MITVAFWSGTGNTQMGADMVAKGITEAGAEARCVSVEEIQPSDLEGEAVFALGCPSMGDEQLEESVMEDFVTAVEAFASGKKIGLFGSYGWGDGQWMRDWVERMQKAGAEVLGGEDAIYMNDPDSDAEDRLKALGAALAK